MDAGILKYVQNEYRKMSGDAKAVMSILWPYCRDGGCVTQSVIADTPLWLKTYEKCDKNSRERRVRQAIRTLRVSHSIPICGGASGYFFPKDIKQASKELDKIERSARARATSSIETYRAMTRSLGFSERPFFAVLEKSLEEK